MFVTTAIKSWKPSTISKYVNCLKDFESFCDAENIDLTQTNFDYNLFLYCSFNAGRVNPRTLDSNIAGVKTLFEDLFMWKIRPTKMTDRYMKGLKASAPAKRFIASRIDQQKLAPILKYGNDFREKSNVLAIATRLQLDLFCRVGNLVGEYPMRLSSLLNDDKSLFFDKQVSLRYIVLVGSKTSLSYESRTLEIMDVTLKKDLASYFEFLKNKKNLQKSDLLFSFDQHEYNNFLNRVLSTTSHGLRSLGARMFQSGNSQQETMKRGGWKSYSSYKRYVVD